MTPSTKLRPLAAAAAVMFAFAAVAAIMLRFIPGPHSQQDYLIVGTLSSLVALVALFAVLGGMGALKGRRPRDQRER